MDQIASTKVFKKTSANSVLTLYLGSRDLICRGKVEPLKGVIYIDPKFMSSQKIYGQLTLTFRYGREDEEVMGLKFCNEAVIAIKSIWPRVNYDENDITPLQQALLDRLGNGAHPFSLEVKMLAPPSIQLVPAKKYNGAPIGTSYDIRIFMSDLNDEKLLRRTSVKLGIRLLHKIPPDSRVIEQEIPEYTSLPKSIRSRLTPKQLRFHHHSKNHSSSKSSSSIEVNSANKKLADADSSLLRSFEKKSKDDTNLESAREIILCSDPTSVETHPLRLLGQSSSIESTENLKFLKRQDSKVNDDDKSCKIKTKGPECCIDKPFLWAEGRVSLKAALNKCTYKHNENIIVNVDIKNSSRKIIRKIRIFAVQHVDVCMFSNGKFKNVVADINENHQIKPNETFSYVYNLAPVKGPTKNWIAVEGSFSQSGSGSFTDSPTSPSVYKLASSSHRIPLAHGEDRNVFAIYVSYYIKIKLTLSGMGGEVSLKLPFILGYIDDSDEKNENTSKIEQKEENTITNDNSNTTKKTTPINHVENIIEEELLDDTPQSRTTNEKCNSSNKNSRNNKQIDEPIEDVNVIRKADEVEEIDEKLVRDKFLLNKCKLKRSSYSRSAEDIEFFCRTNDNNKSQDDNDDDDDDDGSEGCGNVKYIKSRALCHRHSIETNQ